MIIYIEKSLPWPISKKVKRNLQKFSIQCGSNEIFPQKIILSEQEANVLFSEIFMDYVIIEYGFCGGEGCDFSITIKGVKE
jgi:hypothetical protein